MGLSVVLSSPASVGLGVFPMGRRNSGPLMENRPLRRLKCCFSFLKRPFSSLRLIILWRRGYKCDAAGPGGLFLAKRPPCFYAAVPGRALKAFGCGHIPLPLCSGANGMFTLNGPSWKFLHADCYFRKETEITTKVVHMTLTQNYCIWDAKFWRTRKPPSRITISSQLVAVQIFF